jgi:hypothetical protein
VVVEAGGPNVRGSVTWPGVLDVRQAIDGRYWIGTARQVGSSDLAVRADETAAILGRVEETFTGIADRPISAAWAGLQAMPADGLPLVGRVSDADDYYVAVGQGALSFCGVEGRGLASQITGGPIDPLLASFDPARPSPGWQPSDSDVAPTATQLTAGASRLAMRTDTTDWARVGTTASWSGAAGKRLASGSRGRPLRTRAAEWP